MNTYAIVVNGVVDNTIVWDGISQFNLPEGAQLKLANAARIGEQWADDMVELPAIIKNEIPVTEV